MENSNNHGDTSQQRMEQLLLQLNLIVDNEKIFDIDFRYVVGNPLQEVLVHWNRCIEEELRKLDTIEQKAKLYERIVQVLSRSNTPLGKSQLSSAKGLLSYYRRLVIMESRLTCAESLATVLCADITLSNVPGSHDHPQLLEELLLLNMREVQGYWDSRLRSHEQELVSRIRAVRRLRTEVLYAYVDALEAELVAEMGTLLTVATRTLVEYHANYASMAADERAKVLLYQSKLYFLQVALSDSDRESLLSQALSAIDSSLYYAARLLDGVTDYMAYPSGISTPEARQQYKIEKTPALLLVQEQATQLKRKILAAQGKESEPGSEHM